MPLTRVLVIGFGLVLLCGLGVILYIGISGAEKNTRSLMGQLVSSTMSNVEAQVHGQLQPVTLELQYLADHLARSPRLLDQDVELEALLRGALAASPQVLGLGFFDPGGRVTYIDRDDDALSRHRKQIEETAPVRPYLEQPPDGVLWLAPTWSSRLQHSIIPVLIPLRDSSGAFRGLIAAPIDIAAFSGFLARLSEQVGMQVFILEGRERVLAYPRMMEHLRVELSTEHPLPMLHEIDDHALAQFWSDERRPAQWLELPGIDSHSLKIDDVQHVYFYHQLSDYGAKPWLLGVYLERETMPEEVRRLVAMGLAGLAMVLLLSYLVFWISRRIGASLGRIVDSFEAIGRQDLSEISPLAGSRISEFDKVSKAYNRMLRALSDNERVQRLLGQYVPAEIARQLVAQEGALAPQQSVATILFCDLQGFTALSEQLQPPQIVTLLNSYFSAVVGIIESHGGLITQFQGDAILAIFNVPNPQPDHARRALLAALAIQARMESSHFEGQQLVCRVGINTGEVVAGSVGAEDRLNYTVHGDAVNLAARLESLNKEYGTRILLSESTAGAVDGVALVTIGQVEVRGRREQVRIYTPAPEPTGTASRSQGP